MDGTVAPASTAATKRRAQVARLRAAAREAALAFGVAPDTIRLRHHQHNTTFLVEAAGRRYALRINRPGVHGADTVAAETAWLSALREQTSLGVPDPVTTADGRTVVLVDAGDGVPRPCVLFRWQEGRFLYDTLSPTHLRAVARLQAALEDHAARWTRPAQFLRPRVDALTDAGKAASIAAGPGVTGPIPAGADAAAALELIGRLTTPADRVVAERALEVVRATTSALAAQPGSDGLLHADLHQENVLHRGGEARAIDFDDCGWGFWLYDPMITAWDLEGHPRHPALRDALLEELARHRSLPPDVERHLAALTLLRRLQILIWVLESREHPAFHDWRAWADDELAGVRAGLAATGDGTMG